MNKKPLKNTISNLSDNIFELVDDIELNYDEIKLPETKKQVLKVNSLTELLNGPKNDELLTLWLPVDN